MHLDGPPKDSPCCDGKVPSFGSPSPPPSFNDIRKHEKFNEHNAPKFSKGYPVYNFMIMALLLAGFGLGLQISEKLIQTEKERKEIEKEKLNSELSALKNQINPHFFFNTLNNIYSLIQIDAIDAQKATLQLSKLMRYLLYESEHGQNLLSSEIDFMKSYIDLMKLRISDRVEVQTNFEQVSNALIIPPLLFIPFIENAFKYGISYQEPSYIKIILIEISGKIHFICENKIFKIKNERAQGIGIENTSKRLKLLFPTQHNLEVEQTDATFKVKLFIDLTS